MDKPKNPPIPGPEERPDLWDGYDFRDHGAMSEETRKRILEEFDPKPDQ